MLSRLEEFLQTNKNRATFFGAVGQFYPIGSEQYLLIENAYNCAKNAFRSIRREGGDRYFEHLRATALIVLVHMRVRDADVIAAALLHDIIEDVPGWSQEKLALNFNRRVAEYVWYVTKTPESVFGGDKERRNRVYHQNLRKAPRPALIIKMADRLHNLLTLWDTSCEKQRRKIEETQDFYLPIAEEQILLVHELEDILERLQANQC
jgi:GTP pyrophosphokinase